MRQAALDLARAQLAQAEKNLSYAKILAPVSGIVAKKSVAVGDHVAPGQQLVAISQIDVALGHRELPRDAARADAPGPAGDGPRRRASTRPARHGREHRRRDRLALSVLPPENASGNYVKVVQRIPVRIKLDPGQPGLDRLRIGMSVEPR